MSNGRFRLPSLRPPGPHEVSHGLTRLAVWGLVIIAVYILFQIALQVMLSAELTASTTEQQTAIAILEAEQRDLEGQLDYSRSDAAVERLARERLDYVFANDTVLHVITVVPSPTPPAATSTPVLIQPTPTPSAPNWKSWWETLFNRD